VPCLTPERVRGWGLWCVRYDGSKTFGQNVELTEPILSRFDVLLVVRGGHCAPHRRPRHPSSPLPPSGGPVIFLPVRKL